VAERTNRAPMLVPQAEQPGRNVDVGYASAPESFPRHDPQPSQPRPANVVPLRPRRRAAQPDDEAVPPRATTTEPRMGEAQLCQWVVGLFLDSQQARDRAVVTKLWDSWEDGYWGQHWPATLPSYKAPIVINELKRLILHELSDLTDLMPTVYVSADLTSGKRDSQVENAIHAYWQRNFVDMTLLEVCADAAVYPCGFFEVVWDPLAARGQGEVQIRARHPASVFPDPYAVDDERWRYVIVRDVLDVHEIELRWPDQGRRARADATRMASMSPLTGASTSGFGSRGMAMATPLYPISAPIPSQGQDNRATVYTCYVQDSTVEIVPGVWKSPQGEEQLRRLVRHKFPHGRMIQCTQDVVLYDGPNPYRDGFPLLRMVLQPTLHRFWPRTSLVGDMLELQRSADKLESLALENALRLTKALVLLDANSGIDAATFLDVPGQIYKRTPGSSVEFVRPPPLSPELLQMGSRLRDEMAHQMGQTSVRQGQAMPGNRSADLTETEISQGMGITRLRGRFMQKTTVRLVEKLFATMADFYTVPRLIPYFLEEQWAPLIWQPLLERERYAVHVDPNSFVVQSKSMLKRLAVALRKLGALPVEDLLRILEFPQGKEIAARMQQEMQLAAQAAAKKKR
jgi:hypothetical protein